MNPRILIIEDESSLAAALAVVCRREGYDATTCASGAQGREHWQTDDFSLVVLDIGLPDINGLDLLRSLQPEHPTPVLVITAHGNLENAVTARRLEVADYLVKPFDISTFAEALHALVPVGQAETKSSSARDAEPASLLIGGGRAMQEVFSRIAHASMSPLPVLLTGATGTGKTLCGSIIHRHSERRDGPFITLHCSALPEQLLESELFGHERNAFTGANTQRIGHVERANGGTLLLDEIADIPLSVQAKLLRFVEEKVFHRVGGREDIQVDLRLIAATHHDLQEEVSAGRFREDLYYRLRVLTIKMPALNERLEDLDALCSFFLAGADPNQPHVLSPEAHDLLMRYPWPGNIRELRNALEHAVAICGSHTAILPRHLPDEIRTLRGYHDHVSEKLRQQLEKWVDARMESKPDYRDLHDELENMLIRKLLAVFDGKSTALAEALQMNRATLLKKRKRLEE